MVIYFKINGIVQYAADLSSCTLAFWPGLVQETLIFFSYYSQGLIPLDNQMLIFVMWAVAILFILFSSCFLCSSIDMGISAKEAAQTFAVIIAIFGGIFFFALTRGSPFIDPVGFKAYIACLIYLLATQPSAWQIFLLLNVLLSFERTTPLWFVYLAGKLPFEVYVKALILTGPYLFGCVDSLEVVRLLYLGILGTSTIGLLASLGWFLYHPTKYIPTKSAVGKPGSLTKGGKRIPILGVRGSGKSYFLCSLAYVVSRYGWGYPDSETSLYISDMLSFIFKGEPIPPTYKSRPIRVELKEVDLGVGKKKKLNLILSTEDYSGQEYEDAMKQLREAGLSGQLSGTVEKFRQMILNSKGIIIIVDLVGRTPTTPEEFEAERNKRILNALSEQVSPLATGIELLLSGGKDILKKPFFFVFTKSDIHRLTTEQISEYFDKAMAIPMSRLKGKKVTIKKYAVSSVGWGPGEALDKLHAQGFIELIMDIAKLVEG
ncbi:MAG: hypothetical protein KIH09_15055 [Candidatus Freyarchaeota archaeon]|nr:hypothetical protein [Candidatus Jordarchaeia archaeon]